MQLEVKDSTIIIDGDKVVIEAKNHDWCFDDHHRATIVQEYILHYIQALNTTITQPSLQDFRWYVAKELERSPQTSRKKVTQEEKDMIIEERQEMWWIHWSKKLLIAKYNVSMPTLNKILQFQI